MLSEASDWLILGFRLAFFWGGCEAGARGLGKVAPGLAMVADSSLALDCWANDENLLKMEALWGFGLVGAGTGGSAAAAAAC